MKYLYVIYAMLISSFGYAEVPLSEVQSMGKAALPIINEVTESYNFEVLKSHMDPDMLKGNENIYKKMLAEASSLGKLKDCENFQFGKSAQFEGLFVVGSESCPFENGEGGIKLILMPTSNGFSVVQFIIKPYR